MSKAKGFTKPPRCIHGLPWIQHVKFFAKAKGMKYNEALKSSECKNSYKKQK